MACHYCPTHRRSLIPAGYDLRKRRSVPARWHPLSPYRLAIARAWGQAYGCAGQVVIVESACDLCQGGATTAREQ